jgi:hypothetical protein
VPSNFINQEREKFSIAQPNAFQSNVTPTIPTLVAVAGGKLYTDANTIWLMKFYTKNRGKILSRTVMNELLQGLVDPELAEGIISDDLVSILY